jgi:transcriptional regulator with XRE-family HTH domain
MSKSSKMTAGEKILERLKERRLSRQELCKKMRLSESLLCRWIAGSRTPSLSRACMLERELGISVHEWVA